MVATISRRSGPGGSGQELSSKWKGLIDRIIGREGADVDSLIPVLHAAQEEIGYLPAEVQDYVAARLNLPASHVHGVVTFYSFFKTTPSGKHQANVCLGTACYVRGSARLLKDLEGRLEVSQGETTADGRLTLGACRCLGMCDKAPAMIVDGEVHGPLDTNEAVRILEELD